MTPDAAPSSLAILDQPFGRLADLIGQHAAAAPDSIAIIDGDRRLTYRDLDAMMDRVVASLQRDGIAPGGSIAISSGTSADYVVLFMGALRAGVAVAPLAPSSTPDALVTMMTDSGAARIFLDADNAAALGDRPLPAPVTAFADFAAWLAPEGTAASPVEVTPDMAFNIIYSSGTTGAPKGIVQSHAMRWSHVGRGAMLGYTPQTVTLVSTPLYSNTTLVSVIPTLANGGTLVLMAKFDARRALELSAAHGVTHAMLVPVQYRRIMELPDFAAFDLSRYKMKFATSAPFSAGLKADVLARWPGGLVEYFGMTEGGGSCILIAHLYPAKLHTVGQPAPGHDIRLIDDAGVEVPAGTPGEIVGHSPAMMTGYHGQPGKSADARWTSADGKVFIRTGDVGRFDAEGFLTLLDRKKDMIISGGFNIYPSDLEAVLAQAPGVVEGAVVGVPSDAWGETPVGFVVMRDGADPEGARAWTNERLGKTQRLSAIVALDALPRSAIGKVLKRELRDGWRG
nr:class I adenylate-forming enzyme family protein [Polymorphobacter sp.]